MIATITHIDHDTKRDRHRPRQRHDGLRLARSLRRRRSHRLRLRDHDPQGPRHDLRRRLRRRPRRHVPRIRLRRAVPRPQQSPPLRHHQRRRRIGERAHRPASRSPPSTPAPRTRHRRRPSNCPRPNSSRSPKHQTSPRSPTLAHTHTLGQLTERLATHPIHAADSVDAGSHRPDHARCPSDSTRANHHRASCTSAARVNALDWDNVGTIITSTTRRHHHRPVHHQRRRTHQHQDHGLAPHPPDRPPRTRRTHRRSRTDYLERDTDEPRSELQQRMARRTHEHGIDPDDHDLVAGGHRATHANNSSTTPSHATRLAALLARRPTHRPHRRRRLRRPNSEHLAAWRDTHQLPADIPGYGPATRPTRHSPTNGETTSTAALDARTLARPTTNRTTTAQPSTPIDLAAARARLDELDALVRTPPHPTNARLIDDLLTTASDSRIARKPQLSDAANADQEARARLDPRTLAPHRRTPRTHRHLRPADALAPLARHHSRPHAQAAPRQRPSDHDRHPREPRPSAKSKPPSNNTTPTTNSVDLTDERAPLERQLLALRSTLDDPDLPAPVIEQHIARLHERLDDLDARIEHAETEATTVGLGPKTPPRSCSRPHTTVKPPHLHRIDRPGTMGREPSSRLRAGRRRTGSDGCTATDR